MRNAEQGPAEYVSIVQFSGDARTCKDYIRLAGPPPALQQCSGGTLFLPPVQQAKRLMARGKGPVAVIFMSDGGSGDAGAAAGVLKQMADERGSNFSCYTIGFGSGASRTLSQMAFKDGKQDQNNYSQASIGQLTAKFVDIANSIEKSSEASKVLVEEISKEIANKVQNKICLEFL